MLAGRKIISWLILEWFLDVLKLNCMVFSTSILPSGYDRQPRASLACYSPLCARVSVWVYATDVWVPAEYRRKCWMFWSWRWSGCETADEDAGIQIPLQSGALTPLAICSALSTVLVYVYLVSLHSSLHNRFLKHWGLNDFLRNCKPWPQLIRTVFN